MTKRPMAFLAIVPFLGLAAVPASTTRPFQITFFFTGYVQGSFEPCD